MHAGWCIGGQDHAGPFPGRGLHTPWAAEDGRERWPQIGRTFSLAELVSVAQAQVQALALALEQAQALLPAACYARPRH